MKKKTFNRRLYQRLYMRQYYQKHKETIRAGERTKYQLMDETKKNEKRKKNTERNIKRYYLMILAYKYLQTTQPDIIEKLRQKAEELTREEEKKE